MALAELAADRRGIAFPEWDEPSEAERLATTRRWHAHFMRIAITSPYPADRIKALIAAGHIRRGHAEGAQLRRREAAA
jgi:hypothetical protein